jgi:hypothetical protein
MKIESESARNFRELSERIQQRFGLLSYGNLEEVDRFISSCIAQQDQDQLRRDVARMARTAPIDQVIAAAEKLKGTGE